MTEDGYVQGDGWVPGVDFDPSDPEEMEVMRAVWEQERYDALRVAQRENEHLRAENARLTRIVADDE
jgi:hypothetical protein